MEEKKLGIKETKEMLVLLFTLGKVVKEAKENDGKIDMLDIALLMKVLPSIGPAMKDADQIVAEVKDIDGEEVDELLAYIGKEVGEIVKKENLVDQIIKGLEVAKALNVFIKTF